MVSQAQVEQRRQAAASRWRKYDGQEHAAKMRQANACKYLERVAPDLAQKLQERLTAQGVQR